MCRSSQPRIFHSGFAILEIWLANSPRVPSMFLLALVETRDSELLKPTRKREPRAIRCRWGKNSSLRTARRCALFLFDCSRSETARHRETERERERERDGERQKKKREGERQLRPAVAAKGQPPPSPQYQQEHTTTIDQSTVPSQLEPWSNTVAEDLSTSVDGTSGLVPGPPYPCRPHDAQPVGGRPGA